LLSSSQISKVAQSATAISMAYSDSHGIDTITKIQLPDIIPNDNNLPLSSPASPQTITPLPPKIRNTRAPPALTGPTVNDHNDDPSLLQLKSKVKAMYRIRLYCSGLLMKLRLPFYGGKEQIGQIFNSGLSGPNALTTTGKTFSHKFIEKGQYPFVNCILLW
jgi:hypothetical protein